MIALDTLWRWLLCRLTGHRWHDGFYCQAGDQTVYELACERCGLYAGVHS